MIGLLLAALTYFGIAFDPAMTNAPTSARIFPINFVRYKMIQPDGQVRYLHLDDNRPGVLQGDYPWLGTINRNVISVWADPAATGNHRRTAFTFVNGALRHLILDGQNYEFSKGLSLLDGSLESLWPKKKTRSYEKGSTADIWRNGTRLRLWFANPNSAGMFCTQIALLGLWLFLSGRWYRRFSGAGILLLSLVGVVQTGSRGAMLAFIAGAGLMMFFSFRRHFNLKSMALLLTAVGLTIGIVVVSGTASRFTTTLTHIDAGNLRRLKVGKAAIKMFADAPFGWRCGEVPGRNAALNFYVFDDNHVIRTHLLSIAELGWFAGFGYVVFWLFLMAFGFSCAKRESVVAMGEGIAFAVSGLFNPVYTEASLWLLPLAATVWSGWQTRTTMTRRSIAVCGIVAGIGAILIVFVLIGVGVVLNANRRIDVSACGKAAVINGKTPSIWIVEDQKVLGGWGFPGREILAYYAKNPKSSPVAYVWDIRDLPHEVEKLVLPGRAAAEYLAAYAKDPQGICHARKTVFLSPSVGPETMPETLASSTHPIWIVGNLVALRTLQIFQLRQPWVHVISGIEQYVPNWLKIILEG